jgi:FixJ family two-component response regulator
MTPERENPATGLVHVLDDDASVRTALARLLRAVGYEVRAHETAASYLLEPAANGPTCLILDVRMPGLNGLEMQEALARRGDSIPIVFLSGHGDIPMSVQAMRAGAVDFLTKPVRREQLLAAVRAAFSHDSGRKTHQSDTEQLVERMASLTPREKQVFEGVVAGRLNKQIASDIGAAERTVKSHRAHMMEKLQVSSVADLVRLAERLLHSPGSKR